MSHSRFVIALALLLVPVTLIAQEPGDEAPSTRIERPYVYGSFVRVGGGFTSPLFPSGSMHNWDRGWMAAASWESTGPASDRSRVALGFAADIGRYPLDQQQFIANYPTDSTGGRPTTASAPEASLFDLQATIRINIPAPLVTPSILFALGYYNFHPSAVTFQTPDSTGTARFKTRSGASLSIGFGLDRQLVGPTGVFVDGTYMLGATTFGFVAANSRCAYGSCEIFRNTYIGTLRSGLRVRVGK